MGGCSVCGQGPEPEIGLPGPVPKRTPARTAEEAVHPLSEEERQAFLAKLRGVPSCSYAEDFLRDATDAVKADKVIVLAAVKKWGYALQFASDSNKADKEVLLAAVTRNGEALMSASDNLKADKELVLAAVANCGDSLRFAADNLKADKEVVLAAATQRGYALNYATDDLKNDEVVVRAAFRQLGLAVEDGMSVKDMWITRVKDSPSSLEYASDETKKDKEVVMVAVTKNGESLKYSKGGLHQDADCLKAAGLWDAERKQAHNKEFDTLKSLGGGDIMVPWYENVDDYKENYKYAAEYLKYFETEVGDRGFYSLKWGSGGYGQLKVWDADKQEIYNKMWNPGDY